MAHDHAGRHISAFAFDIVREAFRKLVRETNLAEEHWAEHAKMLLRDFSDNEPDESMINPALGHRRHKAHLPAYAVARDACMAAEAQGLATSARG
ncbi:hypothetical protein MLTONO_6074 [Mesorhizobium loti]|nr:hypothetical protein MLTONO_6074 [Mesorhizobium loti]